MRIRSRSRGTARHLATLALCGAVAMPVPAAADNKARRLAIGAMVGIIAGAAANDARSRNQATRPSGGSSRAASGSRAAAPAPTDALPLSRDARMEIQVTLQRLGHYSGAVDGAYGPGTRGAISAFQSSLGAPATGLLSGQQIHDLLAAGGAWRAFPDGDPALFGVELGRDLDREGVRRLQAGLNAAGFDAGPVDGAMGRRTRDAIAAFKTSRGLAGGPFPTGRLLAAVESRPYVGVARQRLGGGGAPIVVAGAVAPAPASSATAAEIEAAAAQPPAILTIMDVGTGLPVAEIGAALEARLGVPLAAEQAGAAAFAGQGPLTAATRWTTPDWPAPLSQSFVALHDVARPELGAIALFRTLRLPPGVDFEASILPRMVEEVGEAGRVAQGTTWIADGAARLRHGAAGPCGSLTLPMGGDGRWAFGNGPLLGGALPTAACGDVLTAASGGDALHIGLWRSDALAQEGAGGAGAALGEIDF